MPQIEGLPPISGGEQPSEVSGVNFEQVSQSKSASAALTPLGMSPSGDNKSTPQEDVRNNLKDTIVRLEHTIKTNDAEIKRLEGSINQSTRGANRNTAIIAVVLLAALITLSAIYGKDAFQKMGDVGWMLPVLGLLVLTGTPLSYLKSARSKIQTDQKELDRRESQKIGDEGDLERKKTELEAHKKNEMATHSAEVEQGEGVVLSDLERTLALDMGVFTAVAAIELTAQLLASGALQR